mmetsp:Transcript_5778/g.19111  ORF Transcript_5778/g.19111 Transcript_5778/m.19111 type:complete len:441 (+) Transcript_5778:595-1917(+)
MMTPPYVLYPDFGRCLYAPRPRARLASENQSPQDSPADPPPVVSDSLPVHPWCPCPCPELPPLRPPYRDASLANVDPPNPKSSRPPPPWRIVAFRSFAKYSARFRESHSAAFASPTSLKTESASFRTALWSIQGGSPTTDLSGWCFRASFRYAFFTSPSSIWETPAGKFRKPKTDRWSTTRAGREALSRRASRKRTITASRNVLYAVDELSAVSVPLPESCNETRMKRALSVLCTPTNVASRVSVVKSRCKSSQAPAYSLVSNRSCARLERLFKRVGLHTSARPQSASASVTAPLACADAARLHRHTAANAPAISQPGVGATAASALVYFSVAFPKSLPLNATLPSCRNKCAAAAILASAVKATCSSTASACVTRQAWTKETSSFITLSPDEFSLFSGGPTFRSSFGGVAPAIARVAPARSPAANLAATRTNALQFSPPV